MTNEVVVPRLSDTPTLTILLQRWSHGDREAAELLLDRVYDDLRRIAHRCFHGERPGHVLQPTALVHEAVLRLMESEGLEWQNRSHFFGLAAVLMRRVLVDSSRERAAAKRGGHLQRVPLAEAEVWSATPEQMLALDQALTDLEKLDPQKALIVELRFFGGLTVDEVAACLGISARTAARGWRRARAFLYRELNPETADGC